MAAGDVSDGAELPRGGRAWPELWRGLTKPSLPALLIALSITVTLFVLCALCITPDSMASGLASRMARDGEDDYCFLTAMALGVSKSQPAKPAIYLLGASAVKESISSCDELAELVSARTGVQPVVYNLSGADQVVWEMAALCEILPTRRDSIVVLEVRPSRFCVGRGQLEELAAAPRLGFASEAFDAEARLAGIEPGGRWGCYFWDNRRFFLPRMKHLVRNLLWGRRVEYVEHRFLGDAPRGWDPEAPQTKHLQARYRRNLEECLCAYTRIVQGQVQRRRARVVLLESPTSPRFIAEAYGGEFYEAFQRRMREYARQQGLPYWNPQVAAKLTQDDFRDPRHLRRREAQRRFTAVLAQRLSEVYWGWIEAGSIEAGSIEAESKESG